MVEASHALVVGRPSRRVHRHRPAGTLALRALGYAFLIALAVAMVFPLVWMVLTSLRPSNTVLGGPIIPRTFTAHAYRDVWNQLHIYRAFINSVLISVVSLAIVLVAATLGGYGFARLKFRGSELLFGGLVSTLFLPGAAILVPVFIELKTMHLVGSRTGLMLIYSGLNVAFAVLLMRVFFDRIPHELADAAHVDGASELRTFWHVMLPLAGPGVATVTILQLLATWNELLFAQSLISKPNLLPLQPELYSVVGQYSTNWPTVTAALTIASIPMIIVYAVLQRRFVAGITAGAISG